MLESPVVMEEVAMIDHDGAIDGIEAPVLVVASHLEHSPPLRLMSGTELTILENVYQVSCCEQMQLHHAQSQPNARRIPPPTPPRGARGGGCGGGETWQESASFSDLEVLLL